MQTSPWNRISYLGVTADMDFRLERRIVLSNRFGLLIAFLTSIFMIVFLFRENSAILPFLGMLMISSSILFFNSIGLIHLSRTITSLIPAVGVFVLNISQKFGAAEGIDILHYATPRMIIVGSAILPFTMFTSGEKGYVWSAVVFILILGLGYDPIHEAMGIDYKALNLTSNHYGIIFEDSVIMAIIILAAAGFMFGIGNQYDLRAQRVLDEALQQTEFLKKNEESLKKTLSELEESRKKDDDRNWVAKGIAELSVILQSESPEKVYDTWLSSLVKFMKVNQGGLFIAEEKEGKTILKQVANYAYERKKYLQREVNPGEGLLGQVYMEAHKIYLKKVPTDYVHITSGLGDAPPHVLIVLPIKTPTGTVEAVMELASFQELQEHHFELLEKLSESLATFIGNSKVNERTRKLLLQAQTMSEEMRANEEEMRQNLEELTATQEALARKEREYQDRIAHLEEELSLVRS